MGSKNAAITHQFHAARHESRMLGHRQRYRQRAYRTEVALWPFVSLTVQPFLLQLGRSFLARLLVLLAVGPLTVQAAVPDETAGRAVLELDAVLAALAPAVDADFISRQDWQDAAHGIGGVGCGRTRRRSFADIVAPEVEEYDRGNQSCHDNDPQVNTNLRYVHDGCSVFGTNSNRLSATDSDVGLQREIWERDSPPLLGLSIFFFLSSCEKHLEETVKSARSSP